MSASEVQIVEPEWFNDLDKYDLHGDIATQERKRMFLNAFHEHGVIYRAARVAGVHRATIYKWLDSDPAFAQAFSDCHEDTYDELEESGFKKALNGDPILTMFYLKAHRPKFRDRMQVDIATVDDEIRQRVMELKQSNHLATLPPARLEQKDD